MTFNKFWVVLVCFIVLFIFLLIVLRAVNLSHDKKKLLENMIIHELEPVGLLKNGALQVLSSWQNQTVLQCLKRHRKNYSTFNIF